MINKLFVKLVANDNVVDRALFALMIIAIVSTPPTVLRIVQNGLLSIFALHLTLIVLVNMLYVLRRYISNSVKKLAILFTCSSISIGALFTFGFVAAGIPWLFITLMFIFVVWPTHLSKAIAISIMLIAISAFGFIQGYLTAPIDPNTMLRQTSFWLGFLIPTIAFMVILLTELKIQTNRLHVQQNELMSDNLKLQFTSDHDHLTSLLNRRGFEKMTHGIFDKASEIAVAVIAIDIDHFKAINDNYGHDGGDAVLREFSAMLSKHRRMHDLLCRHGGEEFIILMLDTSSDAVQSLCERLKAETQKLRIAYRDGKITITASFGYVEATNHTPFDTLLAQADAALYQAKQQGRNCIVRF